MGDGVEQGLVLLLQLVPFVLQPEVGEVGQEGEHYHKTHVFVALYLDYLIGKSLSP